MQVGWREWAALPALGVNEIKVKIDTGALTSSLHAYHVKEEMRGDDLYIHYQIHPLQKDNDFIINACSKVRAFKNVKSSNGHREKRYFIRTPIKIGDREWDIDVTLTNRDLMTYRMLLGRNAMDEIMVIPSRSFIQRKK